MNQFGQGILYSRSRFLRLIFLAVPHILSVYMRLSLDSFLISFPFWPSYILDPFWSFCSHDLWKGLTTGELLGSILCLNHLHFVQLSGYPVVLASVSKKTRTILLEMGSNELKKKHLLSIDSWLLSRDPYFMVDDIIPIKLCRISSNPKRTKQLPGDSMTFSSLIAGGHDSPFKRVT